MAAIDGEQEEAPPDVQLSTAEATTGLFAAAKLGRRALASRCLDLGADINAVDPATGFTPLHFAAFYGYHRVVELLLARGAADGYKDAQVSAPLGFSGLSPTAAGGSGAGGGSASASVIPRSRVVNSPLHVAVRQGHLRCVWALLTAGYSVADVDNHGNTSLHLAAASACTSPAVHLEVLRAVMGAGFDPLARNWHGLTAIAMLPEKAEEAHALLASAMAATKCASAELTFGPDEPRFLCAATGRFFCEEASVPQSVRAFAPALPGITTEQEGEAAGAAASTPALRAAAAFGLRFGVLDLPIASRPSDLALRKPVRMGAEAVFRVADAEAAVEAALEPFAVAIRDAASRLREAAGLAPLPALPSPEPLGSPAGGTMAFGSPGPLASPAPSQGWPMASPARFPAGAVSALEDAVTGLLPSKPSTPALPTRPVDPAAEATALAAIASFRFPLELYFSPEHTAALEAAISACRDARGDVQLIAKGLALLHRLEKAQALREACGKLAAARPLPSRADAALVRVEEVAAAAKAAGVGSAFLSHAQLAATVALGEAELAGAIGAAKAIAVGTHERDCDIQRLAGALKRAKALARLATSLATALGPDGDPAAPLEVSPEDIAAAGEESEAEAVQAGAAPTPGASRPGSAASGAGAGEGGAAAGGADEPGTATDSKEGVDGEGEGKDGGAEGSSAAGAGVDADGEGKEADGGEASPAEPGPSRPASAKVLTMQLTARPAPVCVLQAPPVDAGLESAGAALLSRLRAEVALTDVAQLAQAAHAAAEAATEAHKADDPTELPIPEEPPAPAEEAAAPPPGAGGKAGSRPASGRGGKAGAAAGERPASGAKAGTGKPAPAAAAGKGGKGAAAAEPPPPPPPVDLDMPRDATDKRSRLPETPQLLSVQALRRATKLLDEEVGRGRAAGADEAALEAASAVVASLNERARELMQSEADRVTAARVEKAKALRRAKAAAAKKK